MPQDRGPVEYFATLVTKALVKHGWPAVWKPDNLPGHYAFLIEYHEQKGIPQQDFWAAVSIAVRITARTYRVEVIEHQGWVELVHPYKVTQGGHFKRV